MAEHNDTEILKQKIRDLEAELADRNRDIELFRKELSDANVKIEKFLRQVEKEVEKAAQIQKYMVPKEIPNIPGFEFSTKFLPSAISGGDYYDIFEHDEKFRFGIVMASASGYSMSALFLSVLLKMTGQLAARRGQEPDELIRALVDDLRPQMNPNDSAHLFYGVVDRRHFHIEVCQAGGLALVHHDITSNQVSQILKPTPVLTKDSKLETETKKVTLNPRDRLLFASIGVIEAQNQAGEAFGIERLFQILLSKPKADVHDIRNEVFFQLSQFTGQKDQIKRDQTLVVMEVKDRVIKLATSRN